MATLGTSATMRRWRPLRNGAADAGNQRPVSERVVRLPWPVCRRSGRDWCGVSVPAPESRADRTSSGAAAMERLRNGAAHKSHQRAFGTGVLSIHRFPGAWRVLDTSASMCRIPVYSWRSVSSVSPARASQTVVGARRHYRNDMTHFMLSRCPLGVQLSAQDRTRCTAIGCPPRGPRSAS